GRTLPTGDMDRLDLTPITGNPTEETVLAAEQEREDADRAALVWRGPGRGAPPGPGRGGGPGGSRPPRPPRGAAGRAPALPRAVPAAAPRGGDRYHRRGFLL